MRRAERRRRRRLRRLGTTLVVGGYLSAALAGAVALNALGALGDDDPTSSSSVPPVTADPFRSPPSRSNPLLPTEETTVTPGVGGTAVLSFPTPAGSVTLSVPDGPQRPTANAAPTILLPAHLSSAEARQGVPGVHIVDAEDLPGDYALLLAADSGFISVGSVSAVRFYGENGSRFLPMVGPLAALNDALSELRFDPGPGGGTLRAIVTDFGHGDPAKSRSHSANLEVVG